ncbi:phosphotransferase [Candidatus Palauibacter sp.]|uniref:phosphotransferase n=1 Tax=Candidatus Palauibacter sp. TaxID=3101350 RepID=UPI003B02933B
MPANPPIPASVDAITPAWMQEALAAGGASGLPPIETMTVSGIGAEMGMQAELLRCRMSWRGGAAAPFESVVVKLPSAVSRTRRVSASLKFYRREYDFYRHVAHRLPFRTPALLYGDWGGSQNFVLVLEDLEGREMVPVEGGATAAQARGAVRAIAKLHGLYWENYSDPAASALHDALSRKTRILSQLAYLRYLAPALKHFGHLFSDDMYGFAEAFGPRVSDYLYDIGREPKTFIHGDYYLPNLFYGSGGPDDVIVIDWQVSGIASGPFDVSYFMARSVEPEMRREIEREAVAEYCDIVASMGAGHLTFKACWDLYRRNMLTCLMILVVSLGLIGHTDQMSRRLAEVAMGRLVAAFDDLDAYEFLPGPRPFFSLANAFSASSRLAYRPFKGIA